MGLLVWFPSQKVNANTDAAVLSRSFRHPMPEAYWDDLAHCETNGNWMDKGRFGGGVGMAVTTWVNYGGRQFAPHPSQATKKEQILVARRVAIYGFQTRHTYLTLADRAANRPFFRPPAGWFGWGCIANNRYLHPWVWLRNRQP